jgi:glycosyltransferase involved in cell wall biosynthesis
MIALDLSRLLSRAGRGTPTGIDRVELAYAEHFGRNGSGTCFVGVSSLGGLGLLPHDKAVEFIQAIGTIWRAGGSRENEDKRLKQLARQLLMGPLTAGERPLHKRLQAAAHPPIYLLVSHHHLEKRRIFERLKKRSPARFTCLIHDLIPIEYPEYAKPGQAANHLRRIETVARFADALIVNSECTRDSLQPYLDRTGRKPSVLVAPFGIDLPAGSDLEPTAYERPYFVYVSTIEARKNHLLLLNIWRRFGQELGDAAPRLVLIGQRGWETENVVDMLERCPALEGLVIEHNSLSDAEMVPLIRGARAMLLPSFAEGFGFPVIEALGLGLPVLCSDIPALRETGVNVPEYLDPLDGLGWREAILDYAAPLSPRRDAQLLRLARWQPAQWEDHFAAVDELLAETAARAAVE